MRPTFRSTMLVAALLTGTGVVFLCARKSGDGSAPQIASRAVAPVTVQEKGQIITPAVQALINHATNGDGHQASTDAERLPNTLSTLDSGRLLTFTLGPCPEKMENAGWAVVVNDIWNTLRRQEIAPVEFAHALIQFYRSPDTTVVFKDYAIQHLGAWISADLPEGEGEPDPAVRGEIHKFLVEAIGMHSQTYSGTALYALDRAIQKGGAAQQGDPALVALKASYIASLQDGAIALLRDEAAPDQARMSGFQIALERRDPRALEPARRIAVDPAAAPLLRASAIACLSKIGEASDFELLAPIAKNCSDKRLLGALKPALEHLSKPTRPDGF